jgi:peptidoglycan/xylan/chitin deacetylase (PgdA/CDA1 family)
MPANSKFFILTIYLLFFSSYLKAQSEVAITIDDVPNTRAFLKDDFQSKLLTKLDSLNIPVAIFINEGKLYKTDSVAQKIDLLNNWAKRKYITLGNHSFSHFNYSNVGFEVFAADVIKGESITRELASKHNKSLKHFRFPFNDLGKDSIQHREMNVFLNQKGYQTTPFTIESLDWMYNYVYEYYISKNDIVTAKKIGANYVEKTMAYFTFFEALAQEKYNRPIRQIYMCHDNLLNADYLPIIVKLLNAKKYKFISLDKALRDKIYNQTDNYHKKWGISWMYRWMDTQEERISWMKKEPNTEDIEKLYNQIQELVKKNNN